MCDLLSQPREHQLTFLDTFLRRVRGDVNKRWDMVEVTAPTWDYLDPRGMLERETEPLWNVVIAARNLGHDSSCVNLIALYGSPCDCQMKPVFEALAKLAQLTKERTWQFQLPPHS